MTSGVLSPVPAALVATTGSRSRSMLDVGGRLVGEAADTAVDVGGAGGVRGLRRL
ncbi:hypothetical protein HMPREF9056_01824 [Actinomyces sp. oral taxon 170 str. F0386]|nr:hypothetical protein HMPREF9056_01824 [Actinomyces sp. oral taxon 170 str. F0386]